MDADVYQERSEVTEQYTLATNDFLMGVSTHPRQSVNLLCMMYCTGKLNGEAGEIAEIVFKAYRGGGMTDEARLKLGLEIGDVLWYAARLADLAGFKLGAIMQQNLEKLRDRQDRGTIHGYGENR